MDLMTDLGNADKKAELDRLIEITSRENIVWSSEGGKTAMLIKNLKGKIGEE